jgi:hypothetical protein
MRFAGLIRQEGLVHVGPHPIGAERFATVSGGSSLAQVAGAILHEPARVQNPDKDAVLVDRSGTFTSSLCSMRRR